MVRLKTKQGKQVYLTIMDDLGDDGLNVQDKGSDLKGHIKHKELLDDFGNDGVMKYGGVNWYNAA